MAVCRRWFLGLRVVGTSLGVIALSVPAFAQAPTPGAAAPSPPATPAPAPPAPTPVPPAVAPVPVPEPSAPPAAAAPEATPAPAATLPELPPPATTEPLPHTYSEEAQPAADEDWYDAFDVRVFADAYYGLNYNFPKPQGGNDVIRAFDSANGFSLAWAGIDISHAADPVGGTLALRFGPSANRYNSSCLSSKCDASYGLENIKQAFASWRPGGEGSPVSLDFGKFDTIYGAEVAESQDNINYTRGVLHWLGQPAFHTGLRINADFGQNLSMRALAVNGWNNTVDNNSGKTFGLQATVHAPRGDNHDLVAASLGYLGGPERDDSAVVQCPSGSVFDASSPSGCSVGTGGSSSGTVERSSSNSKGWRHFVDLVVTADPIEQLHVVLNADYGLEEVRGSGADIGHFSPEKWWGAMLGARYLLPRGFAIAARGEYYSDADGLTTGSVFQDRGGQAAALPITGVKIVTGTLTLDYLPTENLVLRLDNRVDHSNKEMFPKGVRELTGTLVTTTFGVVVTTN